MKTMNQRVIERNGVFFMIRITLLYLKYYHSDFNKILALRLEKWNLTQVLTLKGIAILIDNGKVVSLNSTYGPKVASHIDNVSIRHNGIYLIVRIWIPGSR